MVTNGTKLLRLELNIRWFPKDNKLYKMYFRYLYIAYKGIEVSGTSLNHIACFKDKTLQDLGGILGR